MLGKHVTCWLFGSVREAVGDGIMKSCLIGSPGWIVVDSTTRLIQAVEFQSAMITRWDRF